MSDDSDNDNLFGSDDDDSVVSDDTNELIAGATATASNTNKSTNNKNNKRLKTKKVAGGGRENEDVDATGLFDSEEEEDDDDGDENSKKQRIQQSISSTTTSSSSPTKILSKRERMEALQAKKRALMNDNTTLTKSKSSSTSKKSKTNATNTKDENNNKEGYESGDSYDSGDDYIRTKEDDDFIDTQGEDEDLVREYYAEQHFDDERPDDLIEMEYNGPNKNKQGRGKSKGGKRSADALSAEDKKDLDNPLLQAVERMKKKKKVVLRYEELKENAMELITKMENAQRDDEISYKQKRPGLKKLQMLSDVTEAMVKQPMMRPLLESDFLTIVKRWIEPLDNGSLGNVTLRERIIDGVMKMNEEGVIENDDLKRSEFGKLVMTLYMHKKETPEMKRKLKGLIEQWSRRIFGKTSDLKYLRTSQAQRRSDVGLVGIAKAQQAAKAAGDDNGSSSSGKKKEAGVDDKDLGSILANGVKQARDLGRNRVRVPYSKGFQFTVQPENKTGDVMDKKTRMTSVTDQRESLHKRMLEKKKKATKNSRSVNISIEGRPAK